MADTGGGADFFMGEIIRFDLSAAHGEPILQARLAPAERVWSEEMRMSLFTTVDLGPEPQLMYPIYPSDSDSLRDRLKA